MVVHERLTAMTAIGAHLLATVLFGLAIGGVMLALHNALATVLGYRRRRVPLAG